MSQYEAGISDQAAPVSPSLDRENKLLSFSMPLYNFVLLDYSLRRVSFNITAQLHGMFFLAESQWPANPDTPPPPPELTCYRRNLFQITGKITCPRTLRYIMTEQGDRIPILAQEMTVSATESVEGNPVKIISVPWKTPAGGAPTTTEDKAEKEPPSIPLDATGGSDMDADYATFPIQWKRLQFRIATANNGRRKELQQHFVIHLKILATLSTGTKISIAEAHSGAIIVRGRSPRNFQSRKDLPLSTSAGASRKNLGAGGSRTSTGDSVPQVSQSKPAVSPAEVPQVLVPQYENNEIPSTTPDLKEWTQIQTVPEPLPTPDYNNSMMPPQLPPYTDHSPPETTPIAPLTNPNLSAFNAPNNLSFSSDEEGSPIPRHSKPSLSRPPTSNPSPSLITANNKSRSSPLTSPPLPSPPKQRPRFNSQQTVPIASSSSSSSITTTTRPRPNSIAYPPSSSSISTITTSPNQTTTTTVPAPSTSPSEPAAGPDAADTLYEYFPLGLDDWMPPIDAVYRPHVVHHTGPIRRDGIIGKGAGGIGVGGCGGGGGAGGGGGGGGFLGRSRSKRYFSADD